MRALNAIDGIYVFGEHGAAIREFRHVVDAFAKNKAVQLHHGQRITKKDGTDSRFIAWASPFRDDDLLVEFGGMLNRLYTRDLPSEQLKAWGIKEIRYSPEDVIFLNKIWPSAKFIFLLRGLEAQFLSHVVAFHKSFSLPDEYIREFILRHKAFSSATRMFGDAALFESLTLSYEEITAEPLIFIERIVEFLGVTSIQLDHKRLLGIFNEQVDFVSDRFKKDKRLQEAAVHLMKWLR